MSWDHVSVESFEQKLREILKPFMGGKYRFVTGPGRSGAVAAVYASHYLSIPYVPPKLGNIELNSPLLIVDTAEYTGKTLRGLKSWYQKRGVDCETVFLFKETRGKYLKFWYESVR